jgi:hypothetical protein
MLHACLLTVLTCLFAVMYAKGSVSERGILESGWVFTPTRCTLWVDGMCMPLTSSVTESAAHTLAGTLPEYESPSMGLLSSVHPAFLCLAVSVLSFAFSLQSHGISEYSESTLQILKHIAIVFLAVYGALYLFIQERWALPANNVLLVEVCAHPLLRLALLTLFVFGQALHVLGLLFLGTYSFHAVETDEDAESYEEHVLIVNVLLTYPLLAVAVLATAGLDDTVMHVTVFASLTLAVVLLLVGSIEAHTRKSAGQVYVALLSSFWMCGLPFIVAAALRLHYLHSVPGASWATVALCLTLGLYLVSALLATFQLQYLAGLFEFSSSSTRACCGLLSWLPDKLLRGHTFSFLDFGIKASVTLVVVVGIYRDGLT